MPDLVQRAFAAVLTVATLPLIAGLAILIRLDSPGGSFHRATRVGAGGRAFQLIKLRTMRRDAAATGPGVSVRDDARVTRVGRLLRSRRLDELPQIWNVLRGEMLLVGPRPEDPRYVDLSDPLHHRVFTAKPGITGPTQIAFSSEAELIDPDTPEASYRERILPAKLALDARYLERRSFALDLWILVQTARTALGRPPSVARIEDRLGIRQGAGDAAASA